MARMPWVCEAGQQVYLDPDAREQRSAPLSTHLVAHRAGMLLVAANGSSAVTTDHNATLGGSVL